MRDFLIPLLVMAGGILVAIAILVMFFSNDYRLECTYGKFYNPDVCKVDE